MDYYFKFREQFVRVICSLNMQVHLVHSDVFVHAQGRVLDASLV